MKPKQHVVTTVQTQAINARAWAIGTTRRNGGFHIRRIVWGRLLAREEKRDGELVKPVMIYIREPEPRVITDISMR